MLPVDLCLLCSLSAGEDKLAFSVFIELTPDAQVVSHRFARSVINSCAKLAYEHAQVFLFSSLPVSQLSAFFCLCYLFSLFLRAFLKDPIKVLTTKF